MKIAVIAGGTGAAKLVEGLVRIEDPSSISIIVNVGDDTEMHGLYICPDFDMIAYTMAGIIDPVKKWGIADDTFQCLGMLQNYDPASSWFNLGDKDLATHVFRTRLLKEGATLTIVAGKILAALHVEARLLPCTDDRLRTIIRSGTDFLDFQHYFVKEHAEPVADEIIFDGSEIAKATPEVMVALDGADKIVIAPSNPYLSIDPILAIDDIKQALVRRKDDVAFVSPVVAGDAIKGPTVKIMKERGLDPSCVSVAQHYQSIATSAFIDIQDEAFQGDVEALGYYVHVSDTIMDNLEKKENLARFIVSELC
ncbi:MAG TPA: 2-phospho-L-lactate transferase [Candidatus Lokiarchaeia archaeon]|nr:2-phospho-L-lactate transferase [Candidatus Lokiarchaeia archaeon]